MKHSFNNEERFNVGSDLMGFLSSIDKTFNHTLKLRKKGSYIYNEIEEEEKRDILKRLEG